MLWLLAGARIGFVGRDWAWGGEYEPRVQDHWDRQSNVSTYLLLIWGPL